MTYDEGYIKYDISWTPGLAPSVVAARALEEWRRPLFEAGLIGVYEDLDIGYDRRVALFPGHDVDIDANTVNCTGPVKASSEAMTHAAIYALDGDIGAIVHVHSRRLWDRYLDRLPTTDVSVAYGTPEMAREFSRLYSRAGFDQTGVAVMAGHEEGLISFGPTLEVAALRMLALVRQTGSGPVRNETSDTP